MRPLTPPDFLVACVGNRIDPRCAEAMDLVMRVLPYTSIRFVNGDWFAPHELATASLYWVVDVEISVDLLDQALTLGLPILLPSEREDLNVHFKDSDRHTYGTASEAAETIARILGTAVKGIELSKRARQASGAAVKHATAGDR